jgi:acyl phosphate:glycerol-3-phosphate acyltransferase
MLQTYLIIAAVAYLCGSIPFGYILVRLFRGQDIRETGSGNIGATNVARSGATGLAMATLLLDGAKGYLAMWLASLIWNPSGKDLGQALQAGRSVPTYIYLPFVVAALGVVLGHMFPVWLRFKGGKGVATAVGAFLWLSPAAVALVSIVFAALVALTRYVSLGSIAAAAAFPAALCLVRPEIGTPPLLAVLSFTSLLIITKHHQNIRRLFSGSENRFALKRKVAATQLANED